MTGKQLKNSILQWAIQGKLVPQDPNDEPASVLLEKIRQEKERLIKEKKIKRDKNASIIFRGEDNSYYEKFLATGEVKCIDEEIPFEIPQGWEWERWGNLSFSIQYGYNAPAEETGDIRMVRISDIQKGNVLWATVPFCRICQNEIDTYLLKKNDILFARTGGTVGKSFLVNEVPYPSIYAGYLIRTRYSNMLSAQYMKYFMESELYWEQLRNGTIATAQPNCNGKTLAKMFLPVPPYNEQIRITDKLNHVLEHVRKYGVSQDRLDKLNIQILDLLKKSILQEAVQGRLVPQIAEEGTARELLEQIRQEKQKLVEEGKLKKTALTDSIIYKGEDNRYYEKIDQQCKDITEEIPFEIPENWEWCRLGNIISITSGDNLTSKQMHKGTIPVYGGNGITGYHSQANVFEETIVIGRVGFYCGSIHLTPCKAWVTDNAFITRYNKIFNRSFLITLLTALDLGKSYSSTAQPVVSGKKIYPILVALPPLQEQQRIVAQIERLFEQLK